MMIRHEVVLSHINPSSMEYATPYSLISILLSLLSGRKNVFPNECLLEEIQSFPVVESLSDVSTTETWKEWW